LEAQSIHVGGVSRSPKGSYKTYFSANTTHKSPEAANMWSFVQPEVSVKVHIIAKYKCTFIIDENVKYLETCVFWLFVNIVKHPCCTGKNQND
jgi:hypothetical protein